MGLIDILSKKKADRSNLASSGPTTDPASRHSEPMGKLVDGELPLGWIVNLDPYVKKIEDSLPDYAIFAKSISNPVDERLMTLDKMISDYERARAFCYGKDDCHRKYFSDMWEHCHNSRCSDFDYIDPYKELRDDLLANYDQLKLREHLLESLEADLADFLDCNEGVLQKDLYKNFPTCIKSDIQNLLYAWAKEGIVSREKEGSTYRLSLNR